MELRSSRNNNGEEFPSQFFSTIDVLVKTLIKPDNFSRDLIFTLLMVLMEENEFLFTKTETISDYIINIRNKELKEYQAEYILKNFQDVNIKITGSPIGDTMLINTFSSNSNIDSFSICVPIYEYITISALGIPNNICRLDKLSITFKERIINPIKSAIRIHFNFASSNLSGLPLNVVTDILLRLPVQDILSIAKACRRFSHIVEDNGLWRKLCYRDFHDFKCEDGNFLWAYKKMFLAKKKNRNFVCPLIANYGLSPAMDCDGRWEIIL